jgi:DNA-binding IclR family transcriptional regulator
VGQRRPRDADRAGGDVDRYRVRSVARAIGVLEVLSERGTSDGLSVTEIAQECGLSKSIVFSVLHTLRAHGLVADHGEGQSRRYRLGLGLSRLGDRAREQLSLLDLARPVLRELATQVGLSARLAVFQHDAAVSVDRVDVPAHVHIDLRMGAREMLHSTGIGKAMLASLPDNEVERIASAGLPRRTPHTITDRDALRAEIKEIRRVGYAVDDEEDAEGIFCVGSGVRDDSGACVAAISVTGLKTGGVADRYDEIGGALRAAARQISEQLGYTGYTGYTGAEDGE